MRCTGPWRNTFDKRTRQAGTSQDPGTHIPSLSYSEAGSRLEGPGTMVDDDVEDAE